MCDNSLKCNEHIFDYYYWVLFFSSPRNIISYNKSYNPSVPAW